MDLIYMPEVLSYGGLRSPQYRDYEQPWNQDYFNYGKSTTATPHHHRQVEKTSKDSCPLCRESKRRSLAAYIRGKSRKDSCNEINEEDEEDEEINGDVEVVVKEAEEVKEETKTRVVQKDQELKTGEKKM